MMFSATAATDRLLVPPRQTADADEVIMSISSMTKSLCILGGTPAKWYAHDLVAADLKQMLVLVLKDCPDVCCVLIFSGRENTKQTAGHTRTI